MIARRLLSGSAAAALLAGLPALPAAEPPALAPPPVSDLPLAGIADETFPGLERSEPAAAPAEVSERLVDRAFRVRLNENATLPVKVRVAGDGGELVPATGLTLSFLSGGHVPAAYAGPAATGEVAVSVAAGADGTVDVTGLTPGIYSVVGRNGSAYVAFGLHVLPGAAGAAPSRLDVIASPAADVAVVAGLAGRYMRAAGDAPAGAAPLGAAGEVAPAAPAAATRMVKYDETEDLAGVRTPTKRPVLKIGADGVARGRLVSLYDGTGTARPVDSGRVFLIRDGAVASQVEPNAEGEFTVNGLTDGLYTLAALNPIGVSVVGLEVETAGAADVADDADASPFRKVAMRRVVRRQNNDNFETAIVPPLDGGFTLFDVPVGPAGGFAPGGGFGGGGLGGAAAGGAAGGGLPGGLLPALLIGGGIAAAVIASSDDDDGDDDAVSPARPGNGNGQGGGNRGNGVGNGGGNGTGNEGNGQGPGNNNGNGNGNGGDDSDG